MIYRIYSTLPTFKELRFQEGFNVLLADKSPEATLEPAKTNKKTRNGAGKSSFVEIVHFLTAGDCDDNSIFRKPPLVEHSFSMEFDLGGKRVTASRSGKNPKHVVVVADSSDWICQPHDGILTNDEWEQVLGQQMFALTPSDLSTKYGPRFRNLFSYFARRLPSGFIHPHMHFVGGKAYQWQVGISYLLGLDWTIPQQLQGVRDREEEAKKLKAAIGEGDLGEIVGRRAELRAELATVEDIASKLRARLAEFRVLDNFKSLEDEATKLTAKLAAHSNENTIDEQVVSDLSSALQSEHEPEAIDLNSLYEEVGVKLPGVALKQFDDVRRFHKSVIRNRRNYLSKELETTKRRISARLSEQRQIDERRAEIMNVLQSHGALEQFSKLQKELSKKEAQLEHLRARYSAAEKIEEGVAKQKIKRNELLLRLQEDYSEREDVLNKAIVIFASISRDLYETPARFMPTETANGPEFKVDFQAERSPGIGHMQIFCFDMMLTLLSVSRSLGPEFLIHDSHLFDPVDARQVGTALSVATNLCKEHQIQYIITLNSDKQLEFLDDFAIEPYVLPARLTDATENGGLFGIRFKD